jgi:hypothetical protein
MKRLKMLGWILDNHVAGRDDVDAAQYKSLMGMYAGEAHYVSHLRTSLRDMPLPANQSLSQISTFMYLRRRKSNDG